MFIGILIIAIDGNWVVENYDRMRDSYPWPVYLFLGVGLLLVMIAYLINRFSRIHEVADDEKDNRDVINKWWKYKLKIGNWVVGIALVILIAVFIADSLIAALQLLNVFFFIGMTFFCFLFVMQGDRVEEPEDDSNRNPKIAVFLHLIDYRRHPFNLSFLLFVLVVISFLLSKEFSIPLNLEVGGNPRYVTTLPRSNFMMSGVMLASTFIYIIHQSDIFGIRRAYQNEMKVIAVHFGEIIFTGVTFFIWIVTIIGALLY